LKKLTYLRRRTVRELRHYGLAAPSRLKGGILGVMCTRLLLRIKSLLSEEGVRYVFAVQPLAYSELLRFDRPVINTVIDDLSRMLAP
jgi:hypothetical protein